ncbi:MAG: choline dehydrogenase [Pseudomonadales bacterium]
MSSTEASDYVIVGAGSAGCVLANRLTEDPSVSVTLLEAGGSDRHLFVRMPSAFYLPIGRKRFDWCLRSEPEPHMNQRRLHCPRGRVLGGSSSINGMVYVRGHARDFDGWQAAGATDWGYAHCLPYFRKAQNAGNVMAGDAYRGSEGPLATTQGEFASPLYQRFLEAAVEAGYSPSDDLNGYRQEGFGALPMTVADGVRASTAQAYLRPVMGRPNLKVVTQALATRLVVNGTCIQGVDVLRRGKRLRFSAGESVLLCAGAIHSPALLQRSGIGDPAQLRPLGIEVAVPAPGVGRNLMDHLEVYVQQSATRPESIYDDLTLLGRARIGLQWLSSRRGLGATNHFEAGGFIRSRPDIAYPDIQFHFLPAAMSYDGSSRASGHGYQAHVGPMLSASRGSVRLRSSDPLAAPEIRFNYMSCDDDWRTFRAAIRAARDIFAQRAFADVAGPELAPGAAVQSDAELDAFVREHAESAYHPCGTCRMGEDDAAVVDSQARVHGAQGLRVIDASVFPRITNGNLNAPTIMLAERMADVLRGQLLPPDPQPFYTDPNWQEPK